MVTIDEILKNKKYSKVLKLAKSLGYNKADITISKLQPMAKTKENPLKKKAAATTGKTKEEPKKTPRIFVGGGWDNTGKYGTFVNIQINLEKLAELEPDAYGNVRLTVATRKEADEKSKQDLMVYVS